MKKKVPYRVENTAKKKKLLVTSNFSFSHNVFHSYISLACQNVELCGNGLKKKGKKNCGRGENACYNLFFLSLALFSKALFLKG